MNRKPLVLSALIAVAMAAFVACGGSGGGSDDDPIDVDNARRVAETNADIALAAYNDAIETAEALQAALATFAATSSQANLDAAKRAWLVSREPYGQTEVYRFRLSPIDSTNGVDEDGPEGDINAWPLGEELIDYVTRGTDFGDDQVGVTDHDTGVNYPAENIINSAVAIDAALLANTATADDEHDVIAGYHSIEFLLWGQDLNLDGSADTETTREENTGGDLLNSGGHRPLTDFTTDPNAGRRHTFLAVAAQKLIDDLEGVRDGWLPGAAYRDAFTDIDSRGEARDRLTEILTGMGTLSEGELAGERMQIAFSTNSQEDEHSCFSDNTHRDIWLNAEGIRNSYFGEYAGFDSDLDGVDDNAARAVDGYGIDDYLRDSGIDDLEELAAEMRDALDETEDGYEAIDDRARTGDPVDRLILDVNRNAANPMFSTILALNAQSGVIADIAEALDIDETVVDDDASGCDTSDPTTPCP